MLIGLGLGALGGVVRFFSHFLSSFLSHFSLFLSFLSHFSRFSQVTVGLKILYEIQKAAKTAVSQAFSSGKKSGASEEDETLRKQKIQAAVSMKAGFPTDAAESSLAKLKMVHALGSPKPRSADVEVTHVSFLSPFSPISL